MGTSLWMTIVVCGLVLGAAYIDWVVIEKSTTGTQSLNELLIPLPIIVFLLLTVVWYSLYNLKVWGD